MSKYLTQKDLQQLRRLLLGDGRSSDDIKRLFAGPPRLVVEAYEHYYQGLTAADRNRLFAAADRLKAKVRSSPAPSVPAGPVEPLVPRGRGPGKLPAGESFTLVIPPDLLAQYRDLASREQRPVAQLVRLAMRAYLTPSRLGSPEAVPAALPEDS